MNFRWLRSFVFGAIFLFLSSPTNLHCSLPYMSLDKMSNDSELIFVGEVISSCPADALNGQLPTYTCNLSIQELVKYQAAAPLASTSTVLLRVTALRASSSLFMTGDRVLLFCSYNSTTTWNEFYLTNGKPSIFRLRQHRKLGSFFVYSFESDIDLTHIYPKPRGPSPVVDIKSGHVVIGRYEDLPLSEKEFIKRIKKQIKIKK